MVDKNPFEEEMDKYKEQMETARLRIMETQRDLYDLFSDLDKKNLERLRLLLTVISQSDDGTGYAKYWRAWAEHELLTRFDKHPVGTLVDDEGLQDFISE